jgi:acyl-CoA thioester hydrolase
VAGVAFTYRFRVRYQECDAQGIVFNARWGDYVDVAATEYTRALFGAVTASEAGLDWRLRRQTLEWRAPGRFDDVLEARVSTVAVGTTSFTLRTDFHRGDELLVTVETVYVVVDPAANTKLPVPERHRAALLAGDGGTVDASGQRG